MDLLTYDEIRMIEREERDNNKLTNINEDFIKRFKQYEEDKQHILNKKDESIIAKKVKERTSKELINAQNSFKSIFELRARKIFNQALTDIRMGVEPDTKLLLSFEVELYNEIREKLKNHFNNIIKGNFKKEHISIPIKDNNVLVRFVKDLPEFVWKDTTLGPFKQEDIANLPKDIIGLLLKKEAIKVIFENE